MPWWPWWHSCENAPLGRPVGNSNGGWMDLTGSEMYKVLKDMINQGNPKGTNVPTIQLFDISKPLDTEDINARKLCEGAEACPTTGRSKFANCVKMQKGYKATERSAVFQANVDKLVDEQDKQEGGAFGAAVYGKYTLDAADCGSVRAGFRPEGENNGHSCRLTRLERVDTDGYWKTVWKTGGGAHIEVIYAASGDSDLTRGNGHDFIAHHGMGGDEPGWEWANYDGNMHIDVVVRSTLNGLRVRNMTLRTSGGDVYTLRGAHRLNFAYHKKKSFSADTGWGASTYADTKLLDTMSVNGLATPSLFDPLGLVWLLLWKKENLSAMATSVKSSYYLCAAHMHPHFADLITGILPMNYNVCTATRWWSSAEDSGNWYMTKKGPTMQPADIKKQMGDETDWVADKIRKPFFELTIEGQISGSQDVNEAILEEDKRSTQKPFQKLIDVIKYVYFNVSMPSETTKPVDTVKPGGNGAAGNSVADANSATTGNSVTAGNPVTVGNSVTAGSPGANDPSGPTGRTPVPTGTGTPVPTATGTPEPAAAEPTDFFKDNMGLVIGIGIAVFIVIAAIVALIVVRRRDRDAPGINESYEHGDYGDYGDPGLKLEPGDPGL